MIRVYFLPVETIDGTEQVAGCSLIHNALLYCTEQPYVRKLIMDTTLDEDIALRNLAIHTEDALPSEINQYLSQVVIQAPDPDTIRAEVILTSSPDVITMPEIWELMRIFGRRLGYRFD